jgi:hypothetical protein
VGGIDIDADIDRMRLQSLRTGRGDETEAFGTAGVRADLPVCPSTRWRSSYRDLNLRGSSARITSNVILPDPDHLPA